MKIELFSQEMQNIHGQPKSFFYTFYTHTSNAAMDFLL